MTSSTRPLKAGRSFTVVIPTTRLVQLRWDKATYQPGEACELLVAGRGLGRSAVTVVVERQVEGTAWEQVASLEPEVSADKTKANVRWQFPGVDDVAFQGGHLVRAAWDRQRAEPGERLDLTAEAEGLEGAELTFEIEAEDAQGAWRPVEALRAPLAEGRAAQSWVVPGRAGPGDAPGPVGEVLEARFEDAALAPGQLAWAVARARNLDGQQLSFQLELQSEEGAWEPVAHALSTVQAGSVRASLQLPAPRAPLHGAEGSALLEPRFAAPPQAGAPVQATVRALGLEGASLRFSLEAEGPAGWVEVGEAHASVAQGRAAAELTVPGATLEQHRAAPGPVSCRFEGPLSPGSAAALHALAPGRDGEMLTFVLQAEEPGGAWRDVASQQAGVARGEARVTAALPEAAHEELHGRPGPVFALFDGPLAAGAPAALLVRAPGRDGEALTLTLQREEEDGRWTDLPSVEARVAAGEARASAPVPAQAAPPPGRDASILLLPPAGPAVPGEELELRLEAGPALEGERLQAALELEGPDGAFAAVARAELSVSRGAAACRLRWPAPPDPAAAAPAYGLLWAAARGALDAPLPLRFRGLGLAGTLTLEAELDDGAGFRPLGRFAGLQLADLENLELRVRHSPGASRGEAPDGRT